MSAGSASCAHLVVVILKTITGDTLCARLVSGSAAMVLPFLTMPDDVLAHFARQLSDATTAGRLAQTSHAGDRLMPNRLPELREERQAAAQAAAQAKAAKRRAWCEAVYDCFEASEDGVHYRCIAVNK